MQMVQIKKRAKELGISAGKMKKADLIHAIQIKEGNIACFQTGLITCDQYACCWRSDCMPADSGQKESYKDKIKAELDDFNAKLKDLKKSTGKMIGKTKEEALTEIKRLEEKSEKEIKEKLQDLSEAGEDAWQSVRKGIDSSWEELKKGAQKVLSKFK
ncbi:MAG: hypothetical protein KKE17_08870 [Proteobacteria bacterium]|nr:hypothetical protein [Pseudomonadota bacterium]MBU1710100.1 hypothetical protein [Pseudomonadota bacterium]